MPLSPVSSGDPHVSAHNAEREAINDLEVAVDAKIPSPNSPPVGSILRYDGSNWVPAATRLFEDSGSPEGVVAAPTGSRYIDTASTTGAVEWVKGPGAPTDNMGWILLAADTGFRNVSALVDRRTTATVHSAILRRVGDVVDLYLDLAMPNNTASPWNVLTLPSGFRPPVLRYGALQDNKENAANGTSVSSDGVVALYSPITAAKRDRFQGSWTTQNPWPASLPGTAI